MSAHQENNSLEDWLHEWMLGKLEMIEINTSQHHRCRVRYILLCTNILPAYHHLASPCMISTFITPLHTGKPGPTYNFLTPLDWLPSTGSKFCNISSLSQATRADMGGSGNASSHQVESINISLGRRAADLICLVPLLHFLDEPSSRIVSLHI